MYHSITGETISCKPNQIVLRDGSGVGYAIKVSLNTYAAAKGYDVASLFVHLNVTETSMTLYGFHEERERDVFLALIAVSGVGCNTAINILSYMTCHEVEYAAAHENKAAFKAVKGIGEKLAAQIVLDLKGKFKVEEEALAELATEVFSRNAILSEEAISALVSLGFNKTDAKKMTGAAITAGYTALEEIIKHALKSSK